jgi:hypothetical protein
MLPIPASWLPAAPAENCTDIYTKQDKGDHKTDAQHKLEAVQTLKAVGKQPSKGRKKRSSDCAAQSETNDTRKKAKNSACNEIIPCENVFEQYISEIHQSLYKSLDDSPPADICSAAVKQSMLEVETSTVREHESPAEMHIELKNAHNELAALQNSPSKIQQANNSQKESDGQASSMDQREIHPVFQTYNASSSSYTSLRQTHHTQSTAKSGAAASNFPPVNREHAAPHPASVQHIVEGISEAMNMAKGYQKNIRLQELNLDTVLSALSYRSMMQSCFGHEQICSFNEQAESEHGSEDCNRPTAMDSAATRDAGILYAKVPNITRIFEENYMREPFPHSNERACAQGSNCECRFIDPMKGFIAVEFLTLEEMKDPPDHPQLCVICSRKQTQFLYYDMVFNKSVFNGVIQRYGNLSGPGEYASECLLKCTRNSDIACMPKPIMSHQRNRYTVHMHPEHGIYYLKQVRVSVEDHVPNFPLASAAAHQARAHATCQTLSSLAPSFTQSHTGSVLSSTMPSSTMASSTMASSTASFSKTLSPANAAASATIQNAFSSSNAMPGVSRPGKARGF